MKNLKQLCLFLSAGTIAALSISACGDDTPATGGTAGTTSNAGTGTAGSTAGTGTAGTATAGTASGGTASGGTGTAGATTGGGGSGGASGGSGGASGGSGGTGGASGGTGGTGGSGGSGGATSPMCADDDDAANTMSATCDTYCTDFIATCGPAVDASPAKAFYADKAACMTDCSGGFKTKQTGTVNATARLCCEAYHTRNAHTMGLDHCNHAIGMGPCSGK